MKTDEVRHLYNMVQHLMLTIAHMADNQHRIMQGETPFHTRENFLRLIEDMQRKMIEIDTKQQEQ